MTVSSENRKAGPFTGNGVATAFPFTFKVFEAQDVKVLRTSPEGQDVELALDSDYSITLNPDQNANPGGTITYPLSGTPLPALWKLTAIGDLSYLQETDITNQGGFYPQVIEDALDRNVMMIQQVAEESGRSIRVPPSDVVDGLELPPSAARSDKVLGFDLDGNFQVYDKVTGTSVGAVNRQKFTATAGQTDFTTSFSWTVGVNAINVFVNGSKLVLTDDYNEIGANTARLIVGATEGDTVEIVSFGILVDGTAVVTDAAAQAVAAAASASADALIAESAADSAILAAEALDEIVQDLAGAIIQFNNFDLGLITDTPASTVIDLGSIA